MLYQYQCEQGHEQEVRHSIQTSPQVLCEKCQGLMRRIIVEFPHCEFRWRAHDAADTGSDRLTLHNAKGGKLSPHSEWAGKRI